MPELQKTFQTQCTQAAALVAFLESSSAGLRAG
jgi:hypothetical protein